MMLLITNSPCAQKCAAALQKATSEQVKVVSNTDAAITAMRHAEYTAVVFDQNLAESSSSGLETVTRHSAMAVPVEVNLGISSMERIEREVKTALRRRESERLMAMKEASAALRSELKSAVTGILLSSELALSVPALPPAAEV